MNSIQIKRFKIIIIIIIIISNNNVMLLSHQISQRYLTFFI